MKAILALRSTLPARPPPAAVWRDGVWRRDFEHGVVLVNPGAKPVTITVEPGLSRIRGTQAPAVNDGSVATSITLEAKDGIVLQRRWTGRRKFN